MGGKARLVWESYVKVTGITLTLNDKYAESPTITAVFTPSNATNQKVTWSLSNLKDISILSSNDTTCVLSHADAWRNQFSVLTATSADGVTVKYRVVWTYNVSSFWDIIKI